MAEILIRIILPQNIIALDNQGLWQPDSTFGWVHKPSVDVVINTGEHDVQIITDEEGHRVGQLKPDNKCSKKFLVIGDSFLEALSVEHDSLIPGHVARYYNTAYNECLAFDNAAVSGYNMGQYYKVAKHHLAKDNYEFGVVFLFTGNDFNPGSADTVFSPREVSKSKSEFKMPKELTRKEITKAWLYPINEALERNSHLYFLLKDKLKYVLMKVGLSAHYFPKVLVIDNQEEYEWSKVADFCNKIDEEFNAQEADVYFVLIPQLLQIDSAMLKSYADAYGIDMNKVDPNLPNKVFSKEMEKRGLSVIDPTDELRERHSKEIQYGRVDTHLNSAGHKTIAEVLFNSIKSREYNNIANQESSTSSQL